MALENKLGLTNEADLAREEERISKLKAKELFESGYLDSFDVGTFQALSKIHKYLFSDIYYFAGEIRKENIYIPNMENEVEMFKMTNLDYIEVLQNTCKDKRYVFQNKIANMFSKIYEKTIEMSY